MSDQARHAETQQARADRVLVLLFAVAPGAMRAASALQNDGFHVEVVGELGACLQMLQVKAFDLLLLEETVTAMDPSTAERLYAAAGLAVILEVNFGVVDAGRVTQHVRVALRRRSLEQRQMAVAAQLKLQSELSAALTGLLLESQLALRQAGPQWAPTLTRLVDLAEHVSALVVAPAPSPANEQTTILHHT